MGSPEIILVIEDEAHMRTLLQVLLRQVGYECIQASSGAEGVAAVFEHDPSVVLLDLGLPDVDGVDVAYQIRKRSPVPIVVISARDQEEDKIIALDAGANDYVTKPFAAGELLARIRAALRSSVVVREQIDSGAIEIGELRVDFEMRRVTLAGNEIHLTPTEYKLLRLLLCAGGQVVTYRQILKEIWGPNSVNEQHYLRIYMKRLRNKIEMEPAQPRYLVTEPRVGFRFRLLEQEPVFRTHG